MSSPDRWRSVSTPYLTARSPGANDAWTAEAAQHGGVGSNKLRQVETITPPADVAAALGLAVSNQVVVRRRVVLLDGRPVELADSYYPNEIAGGTALAEARRIPGGAVTLMTRLGYPAKVIREDISARPATTDEKSLLNLGEHEWVLVLFRTVFAEHNCPAEVSIMVMRPDSRQLRYELHA